jgi:hypothetical protein
MRGRGRVKLRPLRRRSRGERGRVKLRPLRRRSRGEQGAVKLVPLCPRSGREQRAWRSTGCMRLSASSSASLLRRPANGLQGGHNVLV